MTCTHRRLISDQTALWHADSVSKEESIAGEEIFVRSLISLYPLIRQKLIFQRHDDPTGISLPENNFHQETFNYKLDFSALVSLPSLEQ